ncbi:MAG: hypothetical protein NCW75_04490 [Phycisphaera sp.]|nr:MAG: hypothetical protein NCW75_04490 [Phycisphaera sp.]
MAHPTPDPKKKRRSTATGMSGPSASVEGRGVVVIADQRDVGRLLSSQAKAALGAAPAVLTFDEADDLFALRPDLVLVAADDDNMRWRSLAREFEGEFRMVLASFTPTIEDAAEAMRLGMADLLMLDRTKREISQRIGAMAGEARRKRAGETPQPLALVPTKADVTADNDVDLVTVRAEFGVLARLELDVESLLRTTLEYVLHKIGPTNAAVFLPTAGEDFTLGAYVNYDCPKDCVDLLLDHVAASVAPAIEADPSMRLHRGEDALDELMGDHAAWLTGCEAVTFAAEHDGEMLAAVALFRDDRDPFDARTLKRLGAIGEILAQQLARIIRVHHRHLPMDQWDGPEEQSEDPPMAA